MTNRNPVLESTLRVVEDTARQQLILSKTLLPYVGTIKLDNTYRYDIGSNDIYALVTNLIETSIQQLERIEKIVAMVEFPDEQKDEVES